jgi:hypothetical protein
MTPAAMRNYNQWNFPNFKTTYVSVSGEYDSPKALGLARWMGPNDEVIPVASVHALFYARPFEYVTSVFDAESLGARSAICVRSLVTVS